MRFKLFSIFIAALIVSACGSTDESGTVPSGGSTTVPSGDSAAAPSDDSAAVSSEDSLVSTSEIPGPVAGSQEALLVEVGDRVFYAFDSSALTSEGIATVQKLAAWLSRNPAVTMTLEGHADERGTREYNLALGERRAGAVRNYLVDFGVSPNRLQTISYGKERPEVLGSFKSAWAQNRRTVFVVN